MIITTQGIFVSLLSHFLPFSQVLYDNDYPVPKPIDNYYQGIFALPFSQVLYDNDYPVPKPIDNYYQGIFALPFSQVLYDNDYPVPKPIDFNRHCVIMELVDAFPL